MDIADEAQMRSAHFHNLAMQNRHFDLAPLPAKRQSVCGKPLCIDCDADITKRRQVIPNAQRCTDCQCDHETRSRK